MVGVNIMSKGMCDDWRTTRAEKLGEWCWAYDDDGRKGLLHSNTRDNNDLGFTMEVIC